MIDFLTEKCKTLFRIWFEGYEKRESDTSKKIGFLWQEESNFS